MYKHLFGPVPSRRLGMSLGVDLVPHKVCSLNCVYCECGATTRLTRERRDYVPRVELEEELLHYFAHHPDPDFITFSGAGEPTLNVHLGAVLDFIKASKPDVKVALITNGTLLGDPGLRAELMRADVVLPSLDAACELAFGRINRPGKDFSVEEYVEGLVTFAREFPGEIWLEVMIIPGYNDDPENIEAIGKVIRRIRPSRLQLNTLDRPGAVRGLRAATGEELEAIAAGWTSVKAEIVMPKTPVPRNAFREDVEAAILETITRRPCTLEDLATIMGLSGEKITQHLDKLQRDQQVEAVHQERGIFYRIRLSKAF